MFNTAAWRHLYPEVAQYSHSLAWLIEDDLSTNQPYIDKVGTQSFAGKLVTSYFLWNNIVTFHVL